jgi:hypothetical protein
VQECGQRHLGCLKDSQAHEISQYQPNGRADDPLQQPFHQDHTGDGAALCPQGSQHADIPPALGHHGPEGIENNETAHEERQHAEHVHSLLAQLEAGEHIRAHRQRSGLVIASQGRLDISDDRLALSRLDAVQGDLDGIDLAGLAGHFLGLRQWYEYFLV